MEMRYTLQIDKEDTSVSVLCNGEDIRTLGYKRVKHLENKEFIKRTARDKKALFLLDYPGSRVLEPLKWEHTFENHLRFDDVICFDGVKCAYVLYVEVYEKTPNDLIVIFFYH